MTLYESLADESTQRVALADAPVSYRQRGHGPPMVLLHGWGVSSRYWLHTMNTLADTRTSYALDLPGYGASPPLKQDTSAERLADMVIAFADALGLEQFDLNGHSFGAGVATYVAARYPQRVRRLVLTCFGIFGSDLEQLLIEQTYFQMRMTRDFWGFWLTYSKPWQLMWQSMLTTAGMNPLVPLTMAQPFFYTMPDNLEVLRAGYNEFVNMDQRTSFESVMSLGNPSLRTSLTAIQTPTMLVGARQDTIVPFARIERTANMIPGSRTVWLDQCGHVPMIERPQAYNQIVRAFLNETPVPAA